MAFYRIIPFSLSSVTEVDPFAGYHWNSLPTGSIVVNFGGGIGSESMKIAKAFPALKLIVQDAENVVRCGRNGIKSQYFEDRFPEGLSSGPVTFKAHDFLTPQPVTNARVFFLCFILYDWPDATCIQILKNLGDSTGPDTRAYYQRVLNPLLPNLGYARVFDYLIDLQMAIITNGVERTVGQHAALLQKSGWRLKEVLRMPESSYSLHELVAVPQSV